MLNGDTFMEEFVGYGLTVLGGNCSVKWRVCLIMFDCFMWYLCCEICKGRILRVDGKLNLL